MNDPTTRWLEAMRIHKGRHNGPPPVPLLQLKVKVCECENPWEDVEPDGERRCCKCGKTLDFEKWGPPPTLGAA